MTGSVSLWRLYLMQAVFLLNFLVLGADVWPGIVRHDGAWDPLQGGRIDILVQRQGERCRVRVSDTGTGLGVGNGGLGTGLSTLRVSAQFPRGVCAELDLPAREARW